MRIYRIDHIGQVVPELEPQIERLDGLFGFRRAADGLRWAIPGSWGQYWELQRDPDVRGGLHHVGAEVPDLAAALAELADRGLKPVAGVPGEWADISLTPPERGPGVLFRLRGPGPYEAIHRAAHRAAEPVEPPAGPNLGIVALDHVCQAYPDRDELARWYADLAGFVQVWRTPLDEHPDMADLVLNIPGSSVCWEVIMPRGEDSFIERFLARSGTVAHHVTFEVADWDRAVAACDHHDTPMFGENAGSTDGAAWRDAFIHPKHTGGVLVQLFWEERPGVWVRSDKVPGHS